MRLLYFYFLLICCYCELNAQSFQYNVENKNLMIDSVQYSFGTCLTKVTGLLDGQKYYLNEEFENNEPNHLTITLSNLKTVFSFYDGELFRIRIRCTHFTECYDNTSYLANAVSVVDSCFKKVESVDEDSLRETLYSDDNIFAFYHAYASNYSGDPHFYLDLISREILEKIRQEYPSYYKNSRIEF